MKKSRIGKPTNKNKGFTLIELLAVIVILAIIAIIAVPIILNVVEKARKNATTSSALGYIDTVEKQLAINTLNKEEVAEGTYSVEELTGYKVKVKGTNPSKGYVTINAKKIVETASLCLNNYKIDYSNNKATIDKNGNCDEISEANLPSNYDAVKNVNKPQLTSGMTPIKWVNGVETETTTNDPEWYNYETSQWANVKTKDDSYWVWIPRYAYKITSGYHSSTTGTIDVKFLKGTSNTTIDGTKIESSGYVVGTKDTSMHYFTHPSFQHQENGLGYWVAKYEPTAAEGVDPSNVYTSNGACANQNDNVSTKTIKVVPNVSSWRCINNSNAYKAIVAMKDKKDIYGWNSNEVDPHMMTNLEWGGVTYLSMSKYGTNGQEVYINNSQTYTTGCAGNTVSAGAYNGCQNAFNTATGVKSSTTHNITGVYDMSGGAWDRTMSVYNNLLASSGFSVSDYNDLPSHHITKYNTLTDLTVYGDGVYETSNDAQRHVTGDEFTGELRGSWYADYSRLPYASGPWFVRGASFTSSSNAGLGAFYNTNGGVRSSNSFRPVVFSLK